MRSTTRRFITASLLLALGGAAQAYAQMTAQINGTVTDSTGAVVTGARVTVTNTESGLRWTGASNDVGYYAVPMLQPGNYRISVEKEGFRAVNRPGVRLNVAQTAQLDFVLEVGAVTQSVEVTGTLELLDAGSGSIGQVVGSRAIANLPTNGRNSYSFISLVPGVRAPGGFRSAQIDNVSSAFVSINGARPNQSAFYIDGGTNTQSNFNGPTYTPSLDIVQEFKVQTNNFSAEYTNTAGGVVNLVTKAGTNTFHGSLYEYLRNDKLDANNFFLNRTGLEKPPYRFNQFGGTVGGPIVRNKLFFFAGYEGLRLVEAVALTNTMPTPAQRAGDFTGTRNAAGQMITIYDPLTTRPDPARPGGYLRSAFPGNRIPSARFDPVASNMLRYIPQPNAPGNPVTGNLNFASNSSAPTSKNDVSGRMDYQISSSTMLFGRLSYNRTTVDTPDPYGNEGSPNIGTTWFRRHAAVLNLTHTFSPSFLMELSSAMNRWGQNRLHPAIGFDPTSLGLPAALRAHSQVGAFPIVNITGMAGSASKGNTFGGSLLGNGQVAVNGYDRNEHRANFTKIAGIHTFKFGGMFGVARQNAVYANGNGGTFNFNQGFTQGPDPLRATGNAGLGFASFLLGTPAGGAHPTVQVGMNVTTKYMGGYFQDDIKVTRRLTLNLGIRYDYSTPFTERYNHLVNFDPSGVSRLGGVELRGGLEYPGVDGRPRGAWEPIKDNIAPRFGFAYSLGDSTVLRGGYGIFYAMMSGGSFNNNAIPNTGFNCGTPLVGSVDGGLTPYTFFSNPFPDGYCSAPGSSQGLLTNLGLGLVYTDRGNRTPYSQQWSFDIQQRLPGDLLFEVGYAGNHGLRLMGDLEENQIPLDAMQLGSKLLDRVPNPYYGIITSGQLATPTVTRNQLLRPYPQFLTVTPTASTYGSSIYHALQTKLEKRFAKGFSFLASYTFSKVIDDVGATVVGFPGGSFFNGGIQNFRDRRQERALAGFDTPHNFALHWVWELPFGANKPFLSRGGLLDKIVGGWQVNGITSLMSGTPLQIAGGNANYAFGGGQRPNWNGQDPNLSGSISSRLNRYFNPDVFTANDPFTFGSTPRLMPNLRAPGTANFDLSFFKNVVIREPWRLQFRAEFFNIFNTPQFGLPGANFNTTTFGVIGSQVNMPRDLQFALRVEF